MSGSSQCPHLEFSFQVNVARIEDDTIKVADVTGKCVNCGRPVVWRGPYTLGANFHGPTVSPDFQELRLPLVIEGDEVDETKRRPGFSVQVRS